MFVHDSGRIAARKPTVPRNNVKLKDVKTNNWDARYNKGPNKPANNTKVTQIKESNTWRANHRAPANPSNRAKAPPSPVERNASRLSTVSTGNVNLDVRGPSPLISDQRNW